MRSGLERIYSVRTDGSGLAQLTVQSSGLAQAPNPSPNGRYVAYFAAESGYPSVGSAEILTASGKRAGSIGRWDLRSAAWSPDSKWLVSVTSAGLVLLRAPQLSVRSHLTTTGSVDTWPCWSPGGKAIAFVRSTGLGTWDLLVLRGGGATTVATNVATQPVWSADGKQIAFATTTDTEVVPSRGGVARRVLDAPARLIAWSPSGSDLAVSGADGVSVIAPDGTVRRLTGIVLTSLVWADALYGTDGTRVVRIRLDGQVQTLFQSLEGDAVGDARLWRPPVGTSFHAPEPATETLVAQATPNELETDLPIDNLAADGNAAAVAIACTSDSRGQDIELVWHGGTADYDGPRISGACSLVTPWWRVDGLALAGETPVVFRSAGGIHFYWQLSVGARQVATGLAGVVNGDPLSGQVSDVLAQRDTAVYSTWDLCGVGTCTGELPPGIAGSAYRITQQHLYTVRDGVAEEILRAPGEHTPLALDDGRIAVRSHSTTLDLIDLSGRTLLSIPVGEPILQAALAARELVVRVPGAVRDYDATTGTLTATWPLTAEIDLVGAAYGRAAYTLNGIVYIMRLADGSTTQLADATHARLTPAGLFYSYVGAPPWPGRVRFVPSVLLP